ncbi:MAG: hypothetical protein H7Y59_04490 [Anaerolineales bacterium]|nr:hypothetical protein [Anaerolineales bacterium]
MTIIKIGKKKIALLTLVLVSLVSVALLSAVLIRTNNVTGKYLAQTIQNEPIKLDVPTLSAHTYTITGYFLR